MTSLLVSVCADPESFVKEGPTSTLFLVYEGMEDPNAHISGVSMMAQLGSVVIFQGIPYDKTF